MGLEKTNGQMGTALYSWLDVDPSGLTSFSVMGKSSDLHERPNPESYVGGGTGENATWSSAVKEPRNFGPPGRKFSIPSLHRARPRVEFLRVWITGNQTTHMPSPFPQSRSRAHGLRILLVLRNVLKEVCPGGCATPWTGNFT